MFNEAIGGLNVLTGSILCLGVTIELIAVLRLIKISGAFCFILSIIAPIISNSCVGLPFSGSLACICTTAAPAS